MRRVAEGVDNCVVLLREIREQGYTGGYTILKDFVRPLRHRAASRTTTVRYETEPGEQSASRLWVVLLPHAGRQTSAGVGICDGSQLVESHMWSSCRVLRLSNSYAAISMPSPNLAGSPKKCLYDNTKLVVLSRDSGGAPVWNRQFLDFALRLGIEVQLCRPYRA